MGLSSPLFSSEEKCRSNRCDDTSTERTAHVNWFEFQLSERKDLWTSGFRGDTQLSELQKDYCRGFVGNTITLYNRGSALIAITPNICSLSSYVSGSITFGSYGISPGQFISMECVCGIYEGSEAVFWVVKDHRSIDDTYPRLLMRNGTLKNSANVSQSDLSNAVAIQLNCDKIYYGAHADDAAGSAYPDCTPEFIEAQAKAIEEGSGHKVMMEAPWWNMNKSGVVAEGLRLGMTHEEFEHFYDSKQTGGITMTDDVPIYLPEYQNKGKEDADKCVIKLKLNYKGNVERDDSGNEKEYTLRFIDYTDTGAEGTTINDIVRDHYYIFEVYKGSNGQNLVKLTVRKWNVRDHAEIVM